MPSSILGDLFVEQHVGQATVRLETGLLAKQADGAVVITCGETTVLVTIVAEDTVREGVDFLPLTVDVEERHYAAGRIPGAIPRSEARPSDRAVLTARLTDRPLRPAFPEWFRHEVQVIATVLQVDFRNPYDVLCVTAASQALLLAGVPFAGPIAAVRMAHIDGIWTPNATYEDVDQATVEVVVAGRVHGDDVDVLMVEAAAFSHTLDFVAAGAPAPDEDVLATGIESAKPHIAELCRAQERLVAQSTIPDRTWVRARDWLDDAMTLTASTIGDQLEGALRITSKLGRERALDGLRSTLIEAAGDAWSDREQELTAAFRALVDQRVRRRVLDEGIRIDGRHPTELRSLSARTGLLGRVHGSGLFQRGETQALAITTLDMPRKGRLLDTVAPLDTQHPDDLKRYMHNYRMPPFSVGETGRLGAPRRRELGHGVLAEKALLPVLPPEGEFPYAIRVVSEVLESNGSTSMAAVCASCLSLMDAGVPLSHHVAGIAMGLIADQERHVTLTDILGAEDGFGDMDFKVAGTADVVTALQLDTKTTGISTAVLREALQQARVARLRILEVMHGALPFARPQTSAHAPRIVVEAIPVDKIGELIGPKGKTINDIAARTGALLEVEDDGRVYVAATDSGSADAALEMIRGITQPRILSVGERFRGTVVKITDFGAFVSLLPGRDGLVHISALSSGSRIRNVADVLAVGDRIDVEVREIRPDGKISLVPIQAAT